MMKGTSYTDFIMSVDVLAEDNDAVGIIFGSRNGFQDRYQVHVMNDIWPQFPADNVPGPHMKIKKSNGKPCLQEMTASTNCFDTLAYVANTDFREFIGAGDDDGFQVIPSYPNGEITSMPFVPRPYTPTYVRYSAGLYAQKFTLTLIVKDRQARAVMTPSETAKDIGGYEYLHGDSRVGVWTDLPQDYVGGQLGLFTYELEGATFSNIRVTDLGPGSPPLVGLCEDPSLTCNQQVGLCCQGGECTPPTPAPTAMPTFGTDALVPNPEVCPGAMGGFAPVMRLSSFDLIEHENLVEGPCEWIEEGNSITQTSFAWGNPGDNTLMGCLAVEHSTSVTNFVAEVDVSSDWYFGIGFVFGFQSLEDHYVAIATNAIWPTPAADGISGPMLKIKRRNGKPCLEKMNQFNTCFDTIAWMDQTTSTHEGGPLNYERVYPYELFAPWEDTTMTLIVKDRHARFLFRSPAPEGDDANAENLRHGTKFTSTWTVDLPTSYRGGRVGVMDYNGPFTFTNFKITDLNKRVSGYCNNEKDVVCDSAVSGLCVSVPLGDVCPYPVGAHVIDTSVVTSFEFVDDPWLNDACAWEVTQDGRLSQTSNANAGTSSTLLGCNALVRGTIYTDFIAQVSIENHDNDAVGFGTFSFFV